MKKEIRILFGVVLSVIGMTLVCTNNVSQALLGTAIIIIGVLTIKTK